MERRGISNQLLTRNGSVGGDHSPITSLLFLADCCFSFYKSGSTRQHQLALVSVLFGHAAPQ